MTLTFAALLCTALLRRRRARQHARAPAEEGCSGANASEHDKDSANKKSRYKDPVRAARVSDVQYAEHTLLTWQLLGTVKTAHQRKGKCEQLVCW